MSADSTETHPSPAPQEPEQEPEQEQDDEQLLLQTLEIEKLRAKLLEEQLRLMQLKSELKKKELMFRCLELRELQALQAASTETDNNEQESEAVGETPDLLAPADTEEYDAEDVDRGDYSQQEEETDFSPEDLSLHSVLQFLNAAESLPTEADETAATDQLLQNFLRMRIVELMRQREQQAQQEGAEEVEPVQLSEEDMETIQQRIDEMEQMAEELERLQLRAQPFDMDSSNSSHQ